MYLCISIALHDRGGNRRLLQYVLLFFFFLNSNSMFFFLVFFFLIKNFLVVACRRVVVQSVNRLYEYHILKSIVFLSKVLKKCKKETLAAK